MIPLTDEQSRTEVAKARQKIKILLAPYGIRNSFIFRYNGGGGKGCIFVAFLPTEEGEKRKTCKLNSRDPWGMVAEIKAKLSSLTSTQS